jgi:hypothetical protein
MMYQNKLVAALKANGKVLREVKDTVYVPFGTEYSILLKNLNTVRAIAHITIDGTDVIPGGLVLRAGQEIDIERFVANGNLSQGNRFKFIERTAGIEEFRGVKLEDGIVRIEFQYEKVYQRQDGMQWNTQIFRDGPYYGGVLMGSAQGNAGEYTKGMLGNTVGAVSTNAVNISAQGAMRGMTQDSFATPTSASYSAPQNEAGITVPGSVSDQKFSTCSSFTTESEKHVMVLRLLGETEQGQVTEPVTVKTKARCVTCNRVNKITSKFCSQCGTALQIF